MTPSPSRETMYGSSIDEVARRGGLVLDPVGLLECGTQGRDLVAVRACVGDEDVRQEPSGPPQPVGTPLYAQTDNRATSECRLARMKGRRRSKVPGTGRAAARTGSIQLIVRSARFVAIHRLRATLFAAAASHGHQSHSATSRAEETDHGIRSHCVACRSRPLPAHASRDRTPERNQVGRGRRELRCSCSVDRGGRPQDRYSYPSEMAVCRYHPPTGWSRGGTARWPSPMAPEGPDDDTRPAAGRTHRGHGQLRDRRDGRHARPDDGAVCPSR